MASTDGLRTLVEVFGICFEAKHPHRKLQRNLFLGATLGEDHGVTWVAGEAE